MTGSSGETGAPVSRPVKTNFPSAAERPQKNVAAAMKKYPRRELALVCEESLKTLRVEANHDLVVNDDRWSRTAVVLAHQFEDGALVTADVAVLERDTFLRKVGFRRIAGRSARLGKEHDLLGCHHTESD